MREKFVGLMIAIALGCSSEPPRPRSVPADAVWADGAWIECGQTTKEPYAGFRCAIYRESGEAWTSGHFIHARRENGRWVPVGSPFIRVDAERLDGTIIHRGDGTALVPSELVPR